MSAEALQPRRFAGEYASKTPSHWCPGQPVLTHILNTYTLLVPGNEGYYIRALRQYAECVEDALTRETIKRFCQQEAQHGIGHRAFWKVLTEQGYRIKTFRASVDGLLYKVLEPLLPLKLRLAIVAAIEHTNAYLGHEFLAGRLLEGAEEPLRELFEWHFAEEIEHKDVAFDVFQEASGSYFLRLLGAVLAFPLFYFLMSLGTLIFLAHDGLLFKPATWREWWSHLFSRDHMATRTARHIAAYLRPEFHPSQLCDEELARGAIARSRLLEAFNLAEGASERLTAQVGSGRLAQKLVGVRRILREV